MPEPFLDAAARGKILAAVRNDEILQLAKDIIAIPSHRYHPRQETDVAERIMRVLQGEGIESHLQEVAPGRSNVVGRLGSGQGPRIMLNGHIDTVPAEEMIDPYVPRVRDGNLYGRGASDMKGGVAGMVHALIAIKRSGVSIPGEVIFTGVIAEEQATSEGSLYVSERGPMTDMVVVGEPTNLEVVVAHKGFDNYGIDIKGLGVHSSRPDKGINAIVGASRIVLAIQEKLIPRTNLKKHQYLTPPTINVAAVQGAAKDDSAFFAGDMSHIPGAIVPDHCRVYVDRRRLPGEKMEDIVEDFNAVIRDLRKEHPELDANAYHIKPNGPLPTHPPLETAVDSVLVRHCLHWASDVIGRPAQPLGVPYWSDAAIFNAFNQVPAIVCGPGDIATAHSKRERVPLDQLYGAARIYALLAASVTNAR
jgi:acetylornithine deacetylase/succinyl-diaminopimelate desuccinylase